MSIDRIDNNKVNLISIKAGYEQKQVKGNLKNESIFKALDKDGNGVLDENEINQLKQQVDKDNDGVANKKEAGKFLKETGLNKQKIKDKDLISFLAQYEEKTANVKESAILDNGSVEIIYNDGSSKIINKDKSYSLTTNDENGKTTNSYSSNDVLTKTVVESEISTTETDFAQDGKTPTQSIVQDNEAKTKTQTDYNSQGQKEKSVITSSENSSVATILYEDDKPKTKELKDQNSISNFVFLEDGTERITSKIENHGNDFLEKKTEYKYNEDGSFVEDITQEGTKTHTVNSCNAQGKRLEQTKIVDGKEYKTTYDGDGNTVGIIVQNRETIEQIADKFGCSVDQLRQLNGKDKFAVGDSIKIPGEAEADKPELQNRKTSAEAKAEEQHDRSIAAARASQRSSGASRGSSYQISVKQQRYAQAAARRAQEDAQLKSMGLINRKGAGTKVVGKFKGGQTVTLTKVGNATYKRSICKDNKGRYWVVAHDGVILKSEYVQKTNIFASGKKIRGRMVDKNGKSVYSNFVEVPGTKRDAHGRRVVVDSKGRAFWMAQDGTILKSTYVERSNRADIMKKDSKTARKETIAMLQNQVSQAQAAFDAQMRADGWAGDLADGVSYLWGSKNRASVVRAELKEFRGAINQLAKCKTDAEFNATFKKRFGVPYNQNAVANYLMNPTEANYRRAFGSKINIVKRVDKYNQSQQTGATAVKVTTSVVAATAVTVATGGTGAGAGAAILTAGLSTAGATAVVGISDRMSSEQGLQEGELGEILKESVIDGTIAAATLGASKGVQAVYKGTKLTRAGVKTAQASSKLTQGALKAETAAGKVASASSAEASAQKALAKTVSASEKATGAGTKVSTQGSNAVSQKAASQAAQTGTKAAEVALSKTEEIVIDTGADVVVGAGAEYLQTGEVTLKGTLTNMSFGAVGLVGSKMSRVANKFHINDKLNNAKTKIADVASPLTDKVSNAYGRVKSDISGVMGNIKDKAEGVVHGATPERPRLSDSNASSHSGVEIHNRTDANVPINDDGLIIDNEESVTRVFTREQIPDADKTPKVNSEEPATQTSSSERYSDGPKTVRLTDDDIKMYRKKLGMQKGESASGTRKIKAKNGQKVKFKKVSKNKYVYVDTNKPLNLGGTYILDFNNPEIKSLIDNLQPGQRLTVGRSKHCDITIPSDYTTVSRHHLDIVNVNGKIAIRDRSLNGTEKVRIYSTISALVLGQNIAKDIVHREEELEKQEENK